MDFFKRLLNGEIFNSRKEWANQTRPKNFNSTSVSNKELFLTKENTHNVISSMYSIHTQHGFNSPVEDFQKNIPRMMRKWAVENNINSFEALGGDVNNFIEVLDFINRLFIKQNYELVTMATPLDNHIPDIKVTKYPGVQIGNINEYEHTIERKDLKDLMASDYNQIDVWRHQETNVWDGHYRNGNRIGIDQISRHKRNYDRGHFGGELDGLRTTIENASWENNHQRGYGGVYDEFVNATTSDRNRFRNIRI
jgi:hypothetical protein